MKFNNTTLIFGAIIVIGGIYLWNKSRKNNQTENEEASSPANNNSLASKPINLPSINLIKPAKIVDNTNLVTSMPRPKLDVISFDGGIEYSNMINTKHYFVGDVD